MTDFSPETNLTGSFGQCLRFLLFTHGTRPEGSPTKLGKIWTQADFARALGVSDRTVRYWLNDEKAPVDFPSLQRVLFGTNEAFDSWVIPLRIAYRRAKDREATESKTDKEPGVKAGATPRSAAQILHSEIRAVPGFTGRE